MSDIKDIVQKLAKHLMKNPADIMAFQKDPKSVFDKLGIELDEQAINQIKDSMQNINVGKKGDK